MENENGSIVELENKTLELRAQDLVPVDFKIEKNRDAFADIHSVVEYVAPGSIKYPDFTENSLFRQKRSVVIGITSAIDGEGKSTVALQMAATVAQNNFKNVCLIDMSMTQDGLSGVLGIKPTGCLMDVLENEGHTIQTFGTQEVEGLQIMPSGRLPKNAIRASRSPAVRDVITASRELYDLVIVDLPSVASGNAMPIVDHLDGVIMVVSAGITPREVVAGAMARLDRSRVLGVVLNRLKTTSPRWVRKRFAPWL
jgi:Mrp family chromosome partitioning ATPase